MAPATLGYPALSTCILSNTSAYITAMGVGPSSSPMQCAPIHTNCHSDGRFTVQVKLGQRCNHRMERPHFKHDGERQVAMLKLTLQDTHRMLMRWRGVTDVLCIFRHGCQQIFAGPHPGGNHLPSRRRRCATVILLAMHYVFQRSF